MKYNINNTHQFHVLLSVVSPVAYPPLAEPSALGDLTSGAHDRAAHVRFARKKASHEAKEGRLIENVCFGRCREACVGASLGEPPTAELAACEAAFDSSCRLLGGTEVDGISGCLRLVVQVLHQRPCALVA